MASLKTLMSCAEPGHPDKTKVNLMSKSQTASTFRLVSLCLFKYGTLLLLSTTTFTCVPSIAPMHSLKCGQNAGFSKFGCTSGNVGSLGLMLLCANLRRHLKTMLNVLLTVSRDLLKRLSAYLTDCGAPTIHKNIARASTDVIFLVDFNPYLWTKVLCNL